MSLCKYCRVHNEQSLSDLYDDEKDRVIMNKKYCEDTAIWSEDELKLCNMKIPRDLNGYEVCEHCYNERISK
tara:strand:+ start:59 stop:274 length:216 start_codon:yes stop_codon:yes gene_type:complete